MSNYKKGYCKKCKKDEFYWIDRYFYGDFPKRDKLCKNCIDKMYKYKNLNPDGYIASQRPIPSLHRRYTCDLMLELELCFNDMSKIIEREKMKLSKK